MANMNADFQLYYIIVPINDLDVKKYGYVVVSGYLINEGVNIEGEKRFEVVPVKNVEGLNIENFSSLADQTPIFEDGRCINSIEVDGIFMAYDEAQEYSKAKSLKVFEQKSKEDSYKNIGLVRDLYAYKKMADERLAIIRSEREQNLIEIEKSLNSQKSKLLRRL